RRWALRLIGLFDERRISATIGTPVDGHETRLLGLGNVVERVGHLQRREDALAEVFLEILSGELLNQPPEPVDARAIDPLCPRFEEQRTGRVGLAILRLEIADGRTRESVSEPGCVSEEMTDRDLAGSRPYLVSPGCTIERFEHLQAGELGQIPLRWIVERE